MLAKYNASKKDCSVPITFNSDIFVYMLGVGSANLISDSHKIWYQVLNLTFRIQHKFIFVIAVYRYTA